MPLMRIIITFVLKIEKASSRNWKGLLSKIAESMYPHLTEDSEMASKVLTVLFGKYSGQPVIIGMTDRVSTTRESLGVPETFITF